MGRARDLANILSSSGNVALDSEMGLSLITPTSVATTGGSGSISATGAVSFTSASAVNLNGCFTSSYENYKIVTNLHGTVSADCNIRLRASGTDLSGSIYYNTYDYQRSDNATGGGGNATQSSWQFIIRPNASSSQKGMSSFDIISPQTLDTTKLVGQFVYWEGGSLVTHMSFSGMVNNNLSYDGLTLTPTSGNITGNIKIYGYRN
jgi:hypothetical protein